MAFEFTLVSSIPVMKEPVPNARATALSALLADFAFQGRIGAILEQMLFRLSVTANCIATATFDMMALFILLIFIRE